MVRIHVQIPKSQVKISMSCQSHHKSRQFKCKIIGCMQLFLQNHYFNNICIFYKKTKKTVKHLPHPEVAKLIALENIKDGQRAHTIYGTSSPPPPPPSP